MDWANISTFLLLWTHYIYGEGTNAALQKLLRNSEDLGELEIEAGKDVSVEFIFQGTDWSLNCWLNNFIFNNQAFPDVQLYCCLREEGWSEMCKIWPQTYLKDFKSKQNPDALIISWTVKNDANKFDAITCCRKEEEWARNDQCKNQTKRFKWKTDPTPPVQSQAGSPSFTFGEIIFDGEDCGLKSRKEYWRVNGTLTLPADFNSPDEVIIETDNRDCRIHLSDCTNAEGVGCFCTGVNNDTDTGDCVYKLYLKRLGINTKSQQPYFASIQPLDSPVKTKVEIGEMRFIYLPAEATYKINEQDGKKLSEDTPQTVTVPSTVNVSFCVTNLFANTKTLTCSDEKCSDDTLSTEDDDCVSKSVDPPATVHFSYTETVACKREEKFTLELVQGVTTTRKATKAPVQGDKTTKKLPKKTTKGNASSIGLSWLAMAAAVVSGVSSWWSQCPGRRGVSQ